MANLIFNFSGVYERETFWRDAGFTWRDLKDVPGTYGFCDDAAAKTLRGIISDAGGVHFLDNGNYHYLSLFFLERIHEPFELVLFDHHSDAGEPAFGGLLSCGDWVRAAFASCLNLKRVIAVGPGEDQQALAAGAGKIAFIAEDDISGFRDTLLKNALPAYISLDKDVMSPEVLTTDWDQGAMSVDSLEAAMKLIFANRQVLGVDICGEAASDASDASVTQNDAFNHRLLELVSAQRFQPERD